MSETSLRKPKASSAGAPGVEDVRACTYQAALNNFPIVNFSVDIGKEGTSSAPPLSQAMDLAGQAQQHAGEGATNIDVSMDDGNGHQIQFKGLHTGPSFNIGTGQVGLMFGGVQESAGVIALNMSVYAAKAWKTPLMQASEITGTIPARLLSLIDLIIADWKTEQERRPDSPNKTSAAEIDAANAGPLKILKAILNASSDATIDGLDDALQSAGKSTNKNFNLRLAHILTATASSFWTVVQTICSLFGFVYIPPEITATGENGKLISYEKIWENPSSIIVPTEMLQMSLGNVVVAPISHVAMTRGVTESGFKMGDGKDLLYGEAQESIVRYPEKPKGGRPMTIPMPDFISYGNPLPQSKASTFKALVNLSNTQTTRDWWQSETTKQYAAVKEICRGICKQTYLDVSLADSSATIQMPLDLSISPGKMVDVSAQGGGLLFRGLLRAVTHTLSSQPSVASTALVFSHAQAGSYRIQ